MYSQYVEAIKDNLNVDPNLWNFKSDPRYTQILEHVSKQQGGQYLVNIKNKFPDIYANKELLIQLCHTNDSLGTPTKYAYDGFTTCSPTNLRYIYHALLILDYMAQCKLTKAGINIIEIGGGYGGLAFYIHYMAKIADVTINSYTIYDLPEVSTLQHKYLDQLGVPVKTCCLDGGDNTHPNNCFLISNYGFSELDPTIRQQYRVKVIEPYTSYGFLAWNFIPLYEFVKDKEINTEKEHPLTGGVYNQFVYYKPV